MVGFSFTTLWIYTILKQTTGNAPTLLCFTTLWIYTILKLWLRRYKTEISFTTLWIYTILKQVFIVRRIIIVLLPYGFTLFSNATWLSAIQGLVLLPYGFTLFSNGFAQHLTRLRFYYLMDLHYSQTSKRTRAGSRFVLLPYGFTLFSNYNNYINQPGAVLLPYGFTLFSNVEINYCKENVFYYLMDLHYSQTTDKKGIAMDKFYYLMDLHYSQTSADNIVSFKCFTTLWIYTILKHRV